MTFPMFISLNITYYQILVIAIIFLDFKEKLYLYILDFFDNISQSVVEAKDFDPSATKLKQLLEDYKHSSFNEEKVFHKGRLHYKRKIVFT